MVAVKYMYTLYAPGSVPAVYGCVCCVWAVAVSIQLLKSLSGVG